MFSYTNLSHLKSKQSLLLSSVNKVRFQIKEHSHICQMSSQSKRESISFELLVTDSSSFLYSLNFLRKPSKRKGTFLSSSALGITFIVAHFFKEHLPAGPLPHPLLQQFPIRHFPGKLCHMRCIQRLNLTLFVSEVAYFKCSFLPYLHVF